jgi:hypothetical protein
MAAMRLNVAFVGANGFPAATYTPVFRALRGHGIAAVGHDCFPAMMSSLHEGRSVHQASSRGGLGGQVEHDGHDEQGGQGVKRICPILHSDFVP